MADRSLLHYIVSSISHLLFPPVCYNCRKLFRPSGRSFVSAFGTDDNEMKNAADLLAAFLCPQCRGRINYIESPMCTRCGLPFVSTHGPDHVCGDCGIQDNYFASARSVGLFQSILREMIHQFKFFSATELSRPLGRLLWEHTTRFFQVSQFDHIIPVPLHKERLRKRGFNQAALMVNRWIEFGTDTNRHKEKGPLVRHDCLVRSRATSSQTGLNKAQRSKNLENAFLVSNPKLVEGKHLLIVDDVMTTGATVNACAHALMQAGASKVDVMTLARAI